MCETISQLKDLEQLGKTSLLGFGELLDLQFDAEGSNFQIRLLQINFFNKKTHTVSKSRSLWQKGCCNLGLRVFLGFN